MSGENITVISVALDRDFSIKKSLLDHAIGPIWDFCAPISIILEL